MQTALHPRPGLLSRVPARVSPPESCLSQRVSITNPPGGLSGVQLAVCAVGGSTTPLSSHGPSLLGSTLAPRLLHHPSRLLLRGRRHPMSLNIKPTKQALPPTAVAFSKSLSPPLHCSPSCTILLPPAPSLTSPTASSVIPFPENQGTSLPSTPRGTPGLPRAPASSSFIGMRNRGPRTLRWRSVSSPHP